MSGERTAKGSLSQAMKKYLLIGASAFVLGAGSMAYVSQQALASAQPRAKTYRMLGLFGDALAGGGRSNGLTLAAAKGAPAVSPAAGLVQYVGPVKGWGVIVILRLAGGYHLVLAGLERTSVQVGQSVAEGQPVGWATEGRNSTSELYLEVREQGSPVDPARFLSRSRG